MRVRANDAVFLTQDTDVLRGVRRIVNIPNPAVGTDWSLVVPGGVHWRIIGGTATLTTSAVVNNRKAQARFLTGGILWWWNQTNANLTASAAWPIVYMWNTTLNPVISVPGGITPIPIQPLWLQSGDVFTTVTTLLDAGDQWSGINFIVEEVTWSDMAKTAERWERQDRERDMAQVANQLHREGVI